MALAKTAGLLARMGRASSGSQQSAYFQRADSAYAAWKAVQYDGNHTRDYFIVDYMKRRGLHREAVAIYNDLIERIRQQGDTLGEMMNTAKWGLDDVCHQMGRSEQAATLYELAPGQSIHPCRDAAHHGCGRRMGRRDDGKLSHW